MGSLAPALLPCSEPFSPLRDLHGHLETAGDIYLDTIVHADVAGVLQALTALANCSVDLLSLSVEGKDSPWVRWGSLPALLPSHTSLVPPGTGLHLQVYPFSFLITNRHFSEHLQDPLAPEHQELTRDLGDAVGVGGGRGVGVLPGCWDSFGVSRPDPQLQHPG